LRPLRLTQIRLYRFCFVFKILVFTVFIAFFSLSLTLTELFVTRYATLRSNEMFSFGNSDRPISMGPFTLHQMPDRDGFTVDIDWSQGPPQHDFISSSGETKFHVFHNGFSLEREPPGAARTHGGAITLASTTRPMPIYTVQPSATQYYPPVVQPVS
jgi:hypothetical protein